MVGVNMVTCINSKDGKTSRACGLLDRVLSSTDHDSDIHVWARFAAETNVKEASESPGAGRSALFKLCCPAADSEIGQGSRCYKRFQRSDLGSLVLAMKQTYHSGQSKFVLMIFAFQKRVTDLPGTPLLPPFHRHQESIHVPLAHWHGLKLRLKRSSPRPHD